LHLFVIEFLARTNTNTETGLSYVALKPRPKHFCCVMILLMLHS